jgi:hypothetical protein
VSIITWYHEYHYLISLSSTKKTNIKSFNEMWNLNMSHYKTQEWKQPIRLTNLFDTKKYVSNKYFKYNILKRNCCYCNIKVLFTIMSVTSIQILTFFRENIFLKSNYMCFDSVGNKRPIFKGQHLLKNIKLVSLQSSSSTLLTFELSRYFCWALFLVCTFPFYVIQ